jgi:hypothetical protein
VTRCEMGYGKYSSKNCSPWKEGGKCCSASLLKELGNGCSNN